MKILSPDRSNRRSFLTGSAALCAASLMGASRTVRAEPPPEVSRIRIAHLPTTCLAPQYVAEDLFRLEGFSEVEYVEPSDTATIATDLADGRADIAIKTAPYLIHALDANPPIVVLAGLHVGCYELFAGERINAIRDLKGQTVAISEFGSSEHVFISSMVAYVGMDPRRDIKWVRTGTTTQAMQLFADGQADAFLGFPPEPQELRARNIGRVIVNTALDRPWSNYYCCMIAAGDRFVADNPIAARRVLRGLFKAADLCAREPDVAARYLVAKGYEPRYAVAKEVLDDVRYDAWRTYDPEDALRFHALRLYEGGIIKTAPNEIIAQGTDWRFLNDLRRELKA